MSFPINPFPPVASQFCNQVIRPSTFRRQVTHVRLFSLAV